MKIVFIGLLCVLLLSVVEVEALISLDPDQTFVFNYTNEFNSTRNESFFCSEPEFGAFCNVTTGNVSLIPGESRTYNQGSCSLDLFCSSEETDDQLCVIDKTLDPGESYEISNAACDIEIEVTDPNSCDDVDTYTVTEEIQIEYSNDELNIFTSVQDFRFGVTGKSASQIYEVEFECPIELDLDNQEESDTLIQLCSDYSSVLTSDWIVPTLEDCRTFPQQCESEKMALVEQRAEADKRNGELQGQVSALNATVESMHTRVNDLQKQADEERSQKNTYLALGIVGWFIAVPSVLCCVGLMIYCIRRRR